MSEIGDSSNAREQSEYVQRNRTEGYVIQCDGEGAIVDGPTYTLPPAFGASAFAVATERVARRPASGVSSAA